MRRRLRLEPRLQAGKILLQAADRFRRLLDVVAALVAAANEFHQIVQTHLDRGGVVAADDLGKRPLDVALAAIEVGEQLFDRPSFLQHGNEPIAQSLLAGAQFIDARLQVAADLAAAFLHLRHAFRIGQPLRDRADGAFRIGAGEVMHRRIGVDLRLGQFAHALAHAAEALLERVVGAALAQQGVGEPERRGDQRQWNENDQEPGKLLRQWFRAEGFEQCSHILRLAHDDEPDRKHKQDNANSDKSRHQNTQPHPTNVISFGTTGERLAQAQACV